MNRFILFLALVLCPWGQLLAQDSSFLFSTKTFQPYVQSFVGNGHFSLVTSPLEIQPAASFGARVYAHAERDVPRIAQLPAWNEVNIHNGRQWLTRAGFNAGALRSYHQQLDMYNGLLTSSYAWADGGRVTRITATAFVSRANTHLAAITVEITPEYTGRMMLSFPLRGWDPPRHLDLAVLEKLEPDSAGRPPGLWTVWTPGFMNVVETGVARDAMQVWLVARAESSQTYVAEAATIGLPQDLRHQRVDYKRDKAGVSLDVTFDAEKGQRYVFSKYIAVVNSFDAQNPLAVARGSVSGARSKGYENLRKEHEAAWHGLWQTDIQIDGNSELQKLVHATSFYLLCSIDSGTGFSIPPMGLSTPGYYGHIFWDADTYMFPPLLLMHPWLAESMVRFRHNTLETAKRNAAKNGSAGAKYPWEADERGEETTPKFAAQNATHEIHVTGDVALAQWQYFLGTGDRQWLRETGYPVLQATADYWVSRVSYNRDKRRYDIRDVVSVDEGLIGISNDAYTNAVAEKNLRLALRASDVLGLQPDQRWRNVADSLYIPYDSTRHLHPTYEQAPDSILGSVTALLEYPLETPMSDQARRNDLAAASKRFLEKGGGVMMGETFYPLIAAELGDSVLFQELLSRSFKPHLRGDFWVLAETPTNEAINFITGAGGFLQQVIFGYSGLRLGENGLEKRFRPMLPRGVERMTLRNFTVRGKKFDAVIEGHEVSITEK